MISLAHGTNFYSFFDKNAFLDMDKLEKIEYN